MVARQHKRRHCEQILIQIGPLQISTAYTALLEAILPHTSLYPHLSTTTPDHTIRHVAICVPRPLLFRTSIVFNQLNHLRHVDSTKTRHDASIWSPALYHGAQPALALLGTRSAAVLPYGVQANGSEGEEGECDWESGMRGCGLPFRLYSKALGHHAGTCSTRANHPALRQACGSRGTLAAAFRNQKCALLAVCKTCLFHAPRPRRRRAWRTEEKRTANQRRRTTG